MTGHEMAEREYYADNTIRLADRMVRSETFNHIYDEGMSLVEEAAAYLDGEGRAEAKRLSRIAATLYAAESMRLTTRLMQVASWLLLQRASRSGEMTQEQVLSEKAKVRLDTESAPEDVEGWDEIPFDYCDLVHRSLRLQARVRQMDDEIYNEGTSTGPRRALTTNPVSDQISLLATAFAHR
ncbi:DUF1465 family protein [Phyllobacterium meliloti]|nr:DUF1465 family protein [Phyllobacterium sp. T1293]UGX86136.1 DUF1465 family protein [Phyllobacterium sp. T1293]